MKSIILSAIIFCLFPKVLFSQGKMQPLEVKKGVAIDTLSNIKINKSIYYAKPLEFEYYSLVDTTFIPKWYSAFCASYNLDYFKNYPKDALLYFTNELGITDLMLHNTFDKVNKAGGSKEFYKNEFYKKNKAFRTFLYVFGEIWLTEIKTGKQFVLIQGIYSENKLPNLSFEKKIIAKNTKNESTDSKPFQAKVNMVFENVNDTLKWTNQMEVIGQTIASGKFIVRCDLADFKDMMYRKPTFLQSDVVNGKRIFETMEKGKDGHKKIKESNKP